MVSATASHSFFRFLARDLASGQICALRPYAGIAFPAQGKNARRASLTFSMKLSLVRLYMLSPPPSVKGRAMTRDLSLFNPPPF